MDVGNTLNFEVIGDRLPDFPKEPILDGLGQFGKPIAKPPERPVFLRRHATKVPDNILQRVNRILVRGRMELSFPSTFVEHVVPRKIADALGLRGREKAIRPTK
jgi:hypothetical protein